MDSKVWGPSVWKAIHDIEQENKRKRAPELLSSPFHINVSKFIPKSLQLYFQQQSIGRRYRAKHTCDKQQYLRYCSWYNSTYKDNELLHHEQMIDYWLPELDIQVPIVNGSVPSLFKSNNKSYWIYYCTSSQTYQFLRLP